ncbi:uncharacterized protein LOC116849580 isoform X2 [Odontomachus brunneus]|uniref:uncharacterized protein LOC116849580 isoform X2 n=1 Tax=Odontomachus brunneus TaxID=486640 RepID=UPI0013F25B49|nr:uncharacterized protein LOC116849580 isoform X2 [Odontomachus brunneus]
MTCLRCGGKRIAISYTPVKSRLTTVMGDHVVRLTDREYMTRLAKKLQEDHEARQKARIERMKLKQTSIVPELSALPESLLREMPQLRRRRRRLQGWCAPKLHVEAAKMCKQLPELLLADDSQLEANLVDAE